MSEARDQSRKSVLAALAANSAIAVTEMVAAVLSGSTALLAEGIHSIADTGNRLLLLIGLRLSDKPPDEETRSAMARSASSGRSWSRWRCSWLAAWSRSSAASPA